MNMSHRFFKLNVFLQASALSSLLGTTPLVLAEGVKPDLTTAAVAAAPSWPCLKPPTLSPVIPTDAINSQADFNCFAWQEFIALNWQAEEGQRGQPDTSKTVANFGTPGFNSTVWETYKSAQEVFLPNGTTNPVWNQAPPAPVCTNKLSAAAMQGRRVLTMANSVTEEFDQSSLQQAYPHNGPNWLADINGNVVWYEMKLNETEFNGIIGGLYYNADAQKCIVGGGAYNAQTQVCTPNSSSPRQVKLPTGSMELKAAWRQLTDPSQYPRYLTAQAIVVRNGQCIPMTMGLVGLHIIQKTPSQPNWVWATFEHVDNAPDNAASGSSTYSFYSPSCQTQAVGSCASGGGNTSCTPNTPPAYTLNNWFDTGTCPPYPVQTTRQTPVSSIGSSVNAAARQLIVGANSQSVFQYYQLIDTVWTTSPNDPYAAGSMQPSAPLPMPHMEPGYSVANTTMETFIQTSSPVHTNQPGSMCINCHRNATSAGNSAYGSDYSFLLGSATAPASLKPKVRSLLLPASIKENKAMH